MPGLHFSPFFIPYFCLEGKGRRAKGKVYGARSKIEIAEMFLAFRYYFELNDKYVKFPSVGWPAL